MTRNQLILIAGILVIGTMGYAVYRMVKKIKADKEAKREEEDSKK